MILKNYFKDNKGQTSLELILIVAGIIVLATIIGFYVKSKVVQTQDTNKLQDIINKTKGN